MTSASRRRWKIRPYRVAERADGPVADPAWPALPTETEIYLLPDGRVVLADLPLELLAMATSLGSAEACEITPVAADPPASQP